MKRLKLILGVLIILIVTGIVVALFFSSQKLREAEKEELETTVAESGPPSIEAEKLKYTESEGGKTLYEIESGQAKFFKDESRTEFKDIRVTFYYQDQYEVVVSGDRGELNTDTKDIIISDNVKITAAGDYEMTTDNLTYNAERHEIITEDPILVTGPTATFSGRGLAFNLDTEELFIKSDIVTDIIGEKSEAKPSIKKEPSTDETGFGEVGNLDSPLHIVSGGFMGSRKQNFFRYTNGAVATYKDATLSASTLTVYLSGDSGKIQKIVADGGARIIQADLKGTAGIMTLDYVKKVLTLERNPVVWRGDDMVKGEKILYYLEEKKSVAMGTDANRAHLTIYPKEDF